MTGRTKKAAVAAAPAAPAVVAAVDFEDGGRKFVCTAEAANASRPEAWWWFSVTPDPRNQRYAAFRAAPDDTSANVQSRIVAYYDALLERRSQPSTNGPWGRRPGAPAAAAAPAAATDPVAAQPAPAASEPDA